MFERRQTTQPLRISLLGDVSIEVGGTPAGHRQLRSHQARVVLAMLVLERPRPVHREELSALLWRGAPPPSWESVLRTAVARVRAAFEDAGLDGRAAVRTAFGCYRVRLPEDTVVDVEAAASGLERAAGAMVAGRAADAVACLEEVATVAQQPFLPEADGDWVAERRSRQRALRIRAVEVLSEARLAAGQPEGAVMAAREVIDLDPLRESSHRLLMSLLARSGNRAKALVAYEQCRRLLSDELGVDPSPETEALFLTLLHAESRHAPPGRTRSSGPGLPARLRIESDGLLVGRTRALDLVRRRVDNAQPGPPGIVLVCGEAGMGKTTFVAHAAREVRATGALVLYGRCDDGVSLAYRPVVEGLAQLAAHLPAELVAAHLATYGTGLLRLVPELRQAASPTDAGEGADPRTERHLLYRAVAALLAAAAADRPVMLIVDDLHWADKPSLQLLRYLAVATDPSRLVLVITYRDTELAAGGDAEGTVHELVRQPDAERLVLTGLADDDLVPLVESAAGRRLGDIAVAWAHAIGRESGGNPLFARELLRHLAERFTERRASAGWPAPEVRGTAGVGLPETIRDVVARRVDRLGERTAWVLAQAAVAGQDFDLGTLAAVAGTGEDRVLDDLDRGVAAGLLVELPGDGEHFAFGHALVQRALYERVGPTRRRRLHRRVAWAMESAMPPDAMRPNAVPPDPVWLGSRIGELARHWLLGHRHDEARHAAEWARRAGAHALANLAPDQALMWFREALARLGGETGGDGLHVDVLIGLGEAQRAVGDQGYRETLLTAGRLAEAGGDTARLVRAVVANNRGSASGSGRLDTERVALIESAITAIGNSVHPQRPLLSATMAVELLGTAAAPRRRLLADEAVRGARELGDPVVLGRVLALRFEAIWAPSTHRQRLADSAELLDIAAVSQDRRLQFLAARLRGLACWESGRTADSDEHLDAECRIADEIGEPYLRWVAALSRTARLLASSRHDEAETAAETALRLGSDAGEPDAALAHGVQLLHLRRQQGRSDELLGVLHGTAGIEGYDLRPVIAHIHAETGALGDARAAAADLLAEPMPPPASQVQVHAMCRLAEVASALQDVAAARWLYDRLRGCGGLFLLNQVVRQGPVDHQLGLLATTTGDLSAAVDHFAASVRAASAVPLPYWVAESRVGWARALLRRAGPDDTARARRALERADEDARRFGFAGTLRAVAGVSARAAT